MGRKRDYYEVLGISQNADDSSIKKAYRKLAKKYHPDTNSGNAQSEEKFKEVTEAYNVLSDKEKRKLYDQFGHAAFEEGFSGSSTYGGNPGGYGSYRSGGFGDFRRDGFGGGQPGGGYREYHFEGGAEDMDDILKEFFGSSFGGGFSGYGNTGSRGQGGQYGRSGFGGAGERYSGGGQYDGNGFGGAGGSNGASGFSGSDAQYTDRGQDVSTQISVTFDEAAFGGRKVVRLQKSDGSILSYEVNIPAGIADGKTIRLKGKGAPGRAGGAPGDLLLKVSVLDKPGFVRKGQDVYTTVQVPFATAVFGGEVPVRTIDGTVMCALKPGTQCGTKIRLRGKGIVSMNQPSVRGDQYVTVEIQVPRDLSMESRRKLKEFEQSCAKKGSSPKGSAA